MRGLLCWTCNRDRVGKNDLGSAMRMVLYLGCYSTGVELAAKGEARGGVVE